MSSVQNQQELLSRLGELVTDPLDFITGQHNQPLNFLFKLKPKQPEDQVVPDLEEEDRVRNNVVAITVPKRDFQVVPDGNGEQRPQYEVSERLAPFEHPDDLDFHLNQIEEEENRERNAAPRAPTTDPRYRRANPYPREVRPRAPRRPREMRIRM